GRRQKVLAIMAGFIVAIAGHFSWDAWATVFPIQNTLFGLVEIHLRTLIMTGPFTAALIALLLFGIRYEGQNLLEQMRKEAGPGERVRAQAGRRPPSSLARPRVSSAAALPHVIADTTGSLKSVPLSTAWRKISANAAYARRWIHSHRSLRIRRFK